MFFWIFNILFGYYIIDIEGLSTERFLSLVSRKNIDFWDVLKTKNGLQLKVKRKDLEKLNSAIEKARCKMKVNKKIGYYFKLQLYSKRFILIFGIIFFVLLQYIFSSFIWKIDIIGNKNIENIKIEKFLKENKIKIGTLKFKINKKNLEKLLRNKFEQISWININIIGSKLDIEIVEEINKTELIDLEKPVNIIAKKDGIITSIATSSGTPLKKVGDVVKKDEIIVSSQIDIKSDIIEDVEFVRASSEVFAKVYYNINFDYNLNYIEKKYTENKKNIYKVQINNKYFKLNNKKIYFKNFDKVIKRNQLKIANFKLPIYFLKEQYKEFKPIQKKYLFEEVKFVIEKAIDKMILNDFDSNIDITDKTIKYKNDNEKLNVDVTIITNERIDEEQEINTLLKN